MGTTALSPIGVPGRPYTFAPKTGEEPEVPARSPVRYPFNDLVSILGLTYKRGSYVDDNVAPKLDPENRTVEAFEENDPGDPVQLPPKIKRSGRTQADFEANKITYPHGKNFNPDLINPR